MSITDRRRREVLGSVGIGMAGLAGCTGQLFGKGEGDDDVPGVPDESDTSEESTEGTDSDREPPDWDRRIPTYPYPETGVGPLDAMPDPEADNPVLTAADVTDLDDPIFVSDPFLFVEDGEWHMFFEAVETGIGGVISHATSPDRGRSWEYDRVVLETDWHLSFPYVFKWDDEYYMTTEEGREDAVVPLYRAEEFPTDWTVIGPAYDPAEYGHGVTDHAFFRWNGRWWSIADDANEDTYVYHSDDLESGDWTPHEANPVVEGRPGASRPGGRPIVTDEEIIVFFQETRDLYGASLDAYRITDLTTETYEDERDPASPIIGGTDRSDAGGDPMWNSLRMHHYDPWYLGEGEGWRVVVDGDMRDTEGPNWTIGIYRIPEN